MAMRWLFLAVGAFVLAVGPQLSLCDRPYLGSDFHHSTNSNGLVETIWSIIGRQPDPDRNHPDVSARGLRRDDRMNLIPVTKLTPASPAPWQRAVPTSRELMILESLLSRYRKYMVDKFAHFDDACVLLFDDRDDTIPPTAVESFNDSTEMSLGRASTGRSDTASSLEGEKTSIALQKDDLLTDATRLSQPFEHLCSRSAREFYHCIVDRIRDEQLIGMIQEYLETRCYQDPFTSTPLLQKRDTPRYVSKQKFHSWGGKRSSAQVFYPWGGKRTLVRPHKQPKVVIRNPFHSWGGKKRSDLAADGISD